MEATLRKKSLGSAVMTSLLIAASFLWATYAPEAHAGARRAEQKLSPSVLLSGHADGIHAVAFLPDGKRLISASHDATLKLWYLEIGECLHTFVGRGQPVRAVAISSDGRRVASASQDSTARIWDVETGEQFAQLAGHDGPGMGIAFLPDGTLLTVGEDGTLRIWSIPDERPIWASERQQMGSSLAVTPDGKRAVYGAGFGVCHAWDLPARHKLGDYGVACGCRVNSVAISPDGKLVYIGVPDRVAAAYKIDGGAKAEEPTRSFSPGALGLSADGKAIASFDYVKNAESGELRHSLNFFSSEIRHCYVFSADGRTLAVGGGGAV